MKTRGTHKLIREDSRIKQLALLNEKMMVMSSIRTMRNPNSRSLFWEKIKGIKLFQRCNNNLSQNKVLKMMISMIIRSRKLLNMINQLKISIITISQEELLILLVINRRVVVMVKSRNLVKRKSSIWTTMRMKTFLSIKMGNSISNWCKWKGK